MAANINLRDITYILGIALVYFLCAKFGLSLALLHQNISAIWPPTGVSLAILIILGNRYWPGVFIGAFLSNFSVEGALTTSLIIAAGNSLEAVIGAHLIKIFAKGIRALDNLLDGIKFIFFGGILAPIISALIGVTSLYLANNIEGSAYFLALFTWWLADASSAIVITPFILLWWENRGYKFRWNQIIEIFFILLSIAVIARIIFGGVVLKQINYPLEFLIMPILAWVSIRFTPRGTMTCIVLISIISIWGTLHGYGPFIGEWSKNYELIFLQIFLATIAATSLALAIAVWERKQAEFALQKADQAKDEFLATLSHEMRNPLASVFGYLQLIQIGTLKYAKKKKAIESMESDLRHITSLLDDLLDLSRVRRGKIKLEKEIVDINAILKDAVETMLPLAEDRGHILNIEKAPQPLWIEADARRIKQILMNLLSNAIKYTEENGRIWASTYSDGNNVVVQVRDNGRGMHADSLSKIFDMWNQVGRPVTSLAGGLGGLGIGLSVAKRLVELHGGVIIAESEGLGKGSKFTALFPITPEFSETIGHLDKNELLPHKKKHLADLKDKNKIDMKLKILVVDDNEKAANSLCELLTHFGHDVSVAHTGEDAIKMAQDIKPNVAILDIGLPDIDGYEVGRTLRNMYDGNNEELLLIALSGYGQPEDIKKSKVAGFNYHLIKPVDIVELKKILSPH